MTETSEQEVKAALATILADRAHHTTSLNWALNYAQAAMGMTGKTLCTQCLYILNNLQSWRHPDAKRVRQILRQFSTSRIQGEIFKPTKDQSK